MVDFSLVYELMSDGACEDWNSEEDEEDEDEEEDYEVAD